MPHTKELTGLSTALLVASCCYAFRIKKTTFLITVSSGPMSTAGFLFSWVKMGEPASSSLSGIVECSVCQAI